MNLQSIMVKWLKDNKLDGLFSDDYDCACLNEDLMPCDEPGIFCEPGHAYEMKCNCKHNMDYNWYVSKNGRCPNCKLGQKKK